MEYSKEAISIFGVVNEGFKPFLNRNVRYSIMIPFFFKKKDKDPSNLKRLLLKSTKRKSFSTEPEHRKPPEGQLRTPSRKADKKGGAGLLASLPHHGEMTFIEKSILSP